MKQFLVFIISLASILGGGYCFVIALSAVWGYYAELQDGSSTAGVIAIHVDRPGIGFDRSGIMADLPAASTRALSGTGGGSGVGSGGQTAPLLPAGGASDYLFSPRTTGGHVADMPSYDNAYAYAYTPFGKSANSRDPGMTGYLALLSSGTATSSGLGGGSGRHEGDVSAYAGLRSISTARNNPAILSNGANGLISPDNHIDNAPAPKTIPVSGGLGILIALGLGYALRKRLTLR